MGLLMVQIKHFKVIFKIIKIINMDTFKNMCVGYNTIIEKLHIYMKCFLFTKIGHQFSRNFEIQISDNPLQMITRINSLYN
jgi:hypothetical protein